MVLWWPEKALQKAESCVVSSPLGHRVIMVRWGRCCRLWPHLDSGFVSLDRGFLLYHIYVHMRTLVWWHPLQLQDWKRWANLIIHQIINCLPPPLVETIDVSKSHGHRQTHKFTQSLVSLATIINVWDCGGGHHPGGAVKAEGYSVFHNRHLYKEHRVSLSFSLRGSKDSSVRSW